MMYKRILTALVLIPVFVTLLFTLSPKAFCVLTGLIVLWSGFEWSRLMGIQSLKYRLTYVLMLFFLLVASVWLYIPGVIIGAFAWWLFASVLVALYPKSAQAWRNSIVMRGLMGLITLIPCWLAINFIRNIPETGIDILLFLFVLVWGADIGAYFTGKRFGKTPLAANVSPGKTWQGLYGALMTTLVITLLALYWSEVPYREWFFACLVTIVTVLFSVVGDLFESMLKRNVGLKDSGQLLPGHGGILDRIDSLTAAAPVFLFGTDLMQRIFA